MSGAGIEVSLHQARETVLAQAARLRPGSPRRAVLDRAGGHWLAAPARAERDSPPWPRAMRDGYALRACDGQEAARAPGLRVAGLIRAGDDPWPESQAVPPGGCCEIMTGAPVPPGADTVAMVEWTRREGDRVWLERAPAPGANIALPGSEMRAGEVVLAAGARLDYSRLALLAAVGEARPLVYPRPAVAVLATGDELVEAAAPPPTGGRIRNSNGPAMAALVARAGGRPRRFPIVPDDPGSLDQRLEAALAEADLALVTGGASAGKFDFVQSAWRRRGGEWLFDAVRIRPGRPVSVGILAHQPRPKFCVALPGNPISAMLTFELLARPLIAALAGAAPGAAARPFLSARMGFDYRGKPLPLTLFVPVRLAGDLTAATVAAVAYHGSADLAALAAADAYLAVPENQSAIAAGSLAEVLLK